MTGVIRKIKVLVWGWRKKKWWAAKQGEDLILASIERCAQFFFLIHWFPRVRGFEPSMSPLETLKGVSWLTRLLALGTKLLKFKC